MSPLFKAVLQLCPPSLSVFFRIDASMLQEIAVSQQRALGALVAMLSPFRYRLLRRVDSTPVVVYIYTQQEVYSENKCRSG